ncbi:Polycomb group protein EMBRYONIC FLOWER 2, partial [Sesamum angolense]
NCACNCSYSRGAEHMCRQDPRAHLSAEEQIAAEESLSIYCKPVELYNILQRRAVRNPSFLQRCLRYKIQAKHKKRIQMTISLPSTVNDESRIQSLFPLCILLARPVYSSAVVEDSAVYRYSRECILMKCTGDDRMNQDQANFILPEINKLSAEVKSAELFKEHVGGSLFPANVGGHCFLGKIPMELLHLSWEKSLNLSSGERAEMLSTVDLHSCFLKPTEAVAPEINHQIEAQLEKIQAVLEKTNVFHFIVLMLDPRLRTGNVVFNYKYYNNKLQRTEDKGALYRNGLCMSFCYAFPFLSKYILKKKLDFASLYTVTEDFTCPFCLVKCASFKGLRYHLPSSHDLFNFEFWVTEEFQAVNVSVKTDTWRSEVRMPPHCHSSKAARHRKLKSLVQSSKHVHPLVLDSELPGSINELREKTDGVSESGDRDASSPRVSSATAHSYADPECVQSLPGSNLTPPALLQFAKTRKLSVERSDPEIVLSCRNGSSFTHIELKCMSKFGSISDPVPIDVWGCVPGFLHPMAMEQVLSDRDSEDEVDDDVADLEDRRMLDDFVDVTKDEKQLMHLWNSFVRKQRVLADGHIPWACEAFSKLHGQDLVRTPALLWNSRVYDAS